MEQEGVIKYKLNHQNTPIEDTILLTEINAWRTVLFKLKLIGQIKERYDGYSFGNMSQRISAISSQFVITGTQTGHLDYLTKEHYCTVLKAIPEKNELKSSGETKPSSEALTHASIYQQNKSIQSVIHIHCPEIWDNTHKLQLPYTSKDILYGTPEMANEVKCLFQKPTTLKTQIFSLLGHKDGIISFSNSIENAAGLLLKYYSKALQLQHPI